LNDATWGTVSLDYYVDFAVAFNDAIVYPDDTNVQIWGTFGGVSYVWGFLNVDLLGLGLYVGKYAIQPYILSPLNVILQFPHPVAVATQGVPMDLTLDVGYYINLLDISYFYYLNNLIPQVSILDWITKGSTQYYPSLPAASYTTNTNNGVGGWDWNIRNDDAWVTDPFFTWNLGNYLTNNFDNVNLQGSYFNIDFFQDAEEYM
jgi:hypothetical protein